MQRRSSQITAGINVKYWYCTEAVAHRCSVKKVSLKISYNSPKNTCARVFGCLPVNFKFLRTPFSIEHLWWLLPIVKTKKIKKFYHKSLIETLFVIKRFF